MIATHPPPLLQAPHTAPQACSEARPVRRWGGTAGPQLRGRRRAALERVRPQDSAAGSLGSLDQPDRDPRDVDPWKPASPTGPVQQYPRRRERNPYKCPSPSRLPSVTPWRPPPAKALPDSLGRGITLHATEAPVQTSSKHCSRQSMSPAPRIMQPCFRSTADFRLTEQAGCLPLPVCSICSLAGRT